MKYVKNKIAFLLAMVMLFTAAPVYALSDTEVKDANAAGFFVANSMKLILELYSGGKVTASQLYEGAMRGMVETLDPYSEYFNADEVKKFEDMMSGHMHGLGVVVNINENNEPVVIRLVRESPAEKAGILKQDVIKKINGTVVSGLSLEQVLILLVDEKKSVVQLSVERNAVTLDFSIQKADINIDTVYVEKLSSVLPSAKADDDKIGYIVIEQFGDDTAKEFETAIKALQNKKIKKVIIDLRANPGGAMDSTIDLCNLIVPAGPIFTVIDKAGNKKTVSSTLKTPPFEKVVILTDGSTASAAELFSAAMQDAKAATIVGETSFGKGVVQTFFPLENDGAVKITTMEYLSRNGKHINNIGVVPDVAVPMPTFVYEIIRLDKSGCAEQVKDVKKAVAFLGYKAGEMSTYYDEITKAAITQFQKDKGLTVDGKLSYETVYGLNVAMFEHITKNDPVLKKAYEVILK